MEKITQSISTKFVSDRVLFSLLFYDFVMFPAQRLLTGNNRPFPSGPSFCLKEGWVLWYANVFWRQLAEWSARRTRSLAVPGSSPTVAYRLICSRSSRVQILNHGCKQPTGGPCQLGFLSCCKIELFASKHLKGVPVSKLAGWAKCTFH